MKWKDEFATGVKTIDDQHKMLFRMSEDYIAALDRGHGEKTYPLFLESLILYCKGHFSYEENCMAKHHCSVADQNKDAHDYFNTLLNQFDQRFKENGFDSADARALAEKMEDWLASHICHIDSHLKHCISDAEKKDR